MIANLPDFRGYVNLDGLRKSALWSVAASFGMGVLTAALQGVLADLPGIMGRSLGSHVAPLMIAALTGYAVQSVKTWLALLSGPDAPPAISPPDDSDAGPALPARAA